MNYIKFMSLRTHTRKLVTRKLAICEVFHPVFHGRDENSSPSINSQFLVYTLIDLDEFYSGEYLYEANSLMRYRHAITLLHGIEHPNIRNYEKVARKYMRLEIIQADVLAGGEEVAYLKTFWLRLVQRRWKKIYQSRKEILKKRSEPWALQERQRTGIWPEGLRVWPSGLRVWPSGLRVWPEGLRMWPSGLRILPT